VQAAGGDGEEEEGEEAGDDTLSDIGDSDIDMYLADEAEVGDWWQGCSRGGSGGGVVA
jgi:hypothetical protein